MTVSLSRAMRRSLRTLLAAAPLPAAILTAACGRSPVEPTAPAAAAAQPENLHGYVVSWGKKAPAPTAQPRNLHGYVVSWGNKAPAPAPQPQHLHGYVVSWGEAAGR